MCPTASFVMDRVNPIQETKTGQIYHLYQSNLGSGEITHYFKNIEIDLTYVLNGKQIQDVLKVNNDVAIKTKPSVDLNLNIRTLFNFNTEKLEISENGVEGIYFPVVCNGQMVLKMNRDGVNYRDTIPFNFNHNFYSSNNNLYKVSLTTTNNHQGYFYKLVHA